MDRKMNPLKRILKGLVHSIIVLMCPVKKNQILFDISPSGWENSESLLDYVRKNRSDITIGLQTKTWKAQKIFKEKYSGDRQVAVFLKQARPFFAYKFMLTSKYVFFTSGSPLHIANKRKGQLVINLWHGCGYKDIQNPRKRWIDGTMFDYVLVPGKIFIETKTAFFACRREQVLPIGYPRYDMLLKTHPQVEQKVRGAQNRRVVLWMPTFRNTVSGEAPESGIEGDFDIPLLRDIDELVRLNQYCEEKRVYLYLKKHPAQKRYSCEGMKLSSIIFLDNEALLEQGIQTYELLTVADGLISDYSSVAIDYLLLDRPVAFALADLEQYGNTRGFVFEDPLKYMPGHHLYTIEDLMVFIEDVAEGRDPYAEVRRLIMPEVHCLCNGYCKRIWAAIEHLECQDRHK